MEKSYSQFLSTSDLLTFLSLTLHGNLFRFSRIFDVTGGISSMLNESMFKWFSTQKESRPCKAVYSVVISLKKML